jgi:hypothetical protein
MEVLEAWGSKNRSVERNVAIEVEVTGITSSKGSGIAVLKLAN